MSSPVLTGSKRKVTEHTPDFAEHPEAERSRSRIALVAAVLGFFVVTLDAVVVNVALPTIRRDLGAGIAGLQWVVDGYILMFAALLLWSGALADRIGARRALMAGVIVFVVASAACGSAPSLAALVTARFVQGAAAAVMMPASMALLGQSFPDPVRRARAVAIWAVGGALASSAGPVLGGLLSSSRPPAMTRARSTTPTATSTPATRPTSTR